MKLDDIAAVPANVAFWLVSSVSAVIPADSIVNGVAAGLVRVVAVNVEVVVEVALSDEIVADVEFSVGAVSVVMDAAETERVVPLKVKPVEPVIPPAPLLY